MCSIAALALLLLTDPHAVEAQSARIPRVGVLSGGSAQPLYLLDAFRHALAELDHVEGKTVRIEYRFAEGNPERLRGLADELVALPVDVIFTVNTPASRAAKAATATIPIVFTWVVDPLSLVASLGRPGGNVTGLTSMTGDLSPKRLELLRDALPGLARVAVLWNEGNPTATRVCRDMEAVSPQFGIRILRVSVRGAGEIRNAVDTAARERAGALFVIEEAMLLPHRALILELAAQHRLPTASTSREFVTAGGLLSYGPNLPDLFRGAARYVDKILRGAKAADLPVEQPTRFDLTINLKTARALRLSIPQSVLTRADELHD